MSTLDELFAADPQSQKWRSLLKQRRENGSSLFLTNDELLDAFDEYRTLLSAHPYTRPHVFAERDATAEYPRLLTLQGFASFIGAATTTLKSWLNPTSPLHDAMSQIDTTIKAQALELAAQQAVPQQLVIRLLGKDMAEHVQQETTIEDRAPKHEFRQMLRGLDAYIKELEQGEIVDKT